MDSAARSDTELFSAVNRGDVKRTARAIAVGADPNRRGPGGMTPLIMAVHLGHIEVASVLLRAGADVNAHDNRGQTALKLARSRTRGVRSASFTLFGFDLLFRRPVSQQDDGTDELVQLLVKAGAR